MTPNTSPNHPHLRKAFAAHLKSEQMWPCDAALLPMFANNSRQAYSVSRSCLMIQIGAEQATTVLLLTSISPQPCLFAFGSAFVALGLALVSSSSKAALGPVKYCSSCHPSSAMCTPVSSTCGLTLSSPPSSSSSWTILLSVASISLLSLTPSLPNS